MNSFLVFSTLVACSGLTFAALTMDEIKSTGKILRNHCQRTTGVTDELVDAAGEGEFSDDRTLKCFLGCMMGLSHALKDGRYQADVVLQVAEDLLPEEIKGRVKNVVEKCRNAGEGIEDECEIALLITKCAYDVDKENFYLP